MHNPRLLHARRPRGWGREKGWAALAAFDVLAVAVTGSGVGGGGLQTALGLPLVLVIPGYTVTALLWPHRSLGLPERGMTAVGVSLALAAVSGLVLNWLPGGMNVRGSTVLLGLVALVAIAALLLRERRRPADLDNGLDTLWGPRPTIIVRPRQAVLLAVAIGLVMAAVAFAVHSAEGNAGPAFTQAWLVPNQTEGGPLAVGLENDERQADTYRLQLSVGSRVVREWDRIQLAPGQSWSTTATLPAGSAGEVANLSVYREGSSSRVYRQVHVSLAGSRP